LVWSDADLTISIKRSKVLAVSDVTKIYDQKWVALEEVSFSAQKGEFIKLVGPSGSGKTTLLKLIYMEERPTRGVIKVADFSSEEITARQMPLLRRHLGVIFQDFRLLDDRDLFANVNLALRICGIKGKQATKRVTEVLGIVGLSPKSHENPSSLSGGEKQKLAIARALASNPYLLLADEPTGSLDHVNATMIIDLLHHISQMGTTVIVSSHKDELLEGWSGRLLRLENGKLI
jgi:cell division transport system ATP-binding protein